MVIVWRASLSRECLTLVRETFALISILPLALMLSACAQVSQDGEFERVAQDVHNRTNLRAQWRMTSSLAAEEDSHIQSLLTEVLSEKTVAQIALLNNPELQAKYADLGLAHADIVQAGLLPNPMVGGLVMIPERGATTLTFDVAFNFLSVLTMPLRSAVAESAYEEVRLRMVKATVDLVAEAEKKYYTAVANIYLKDLADQWWTASKAHYETVKALREAGNVSDLDLLMAQAQEKQAHLDFKEAALAEYQARLDLLKVLGLNETQSLHLPKELPRSKEIDIEGLKTNAFENSLDLAILKQRLETSGKKHKVLNVTSLLPELGMGGELEKDTDQWKGGPRVELVLPLFDQGQVELAKAQFEIRSIQEMFVATSLQLKLYLTSLIDKFKLSRSRLAELKEMLALQQKILRQTLLHYNAMNKGIVDLIRSKQNEIVAKKQLSESLLSDQLLTTTMNQVRYGVMASPSALQEGVGMPAMKMLPEGGH